MQRFEMIEGRFVHFPDELGIVHEGEIVAAWLEADEGVGNGRGEAPGQISIRITVACTDHRFREAWLTNCTDGSAPRPKKKEDE